MRNLSGVWDMCTTLVVGGARSGKSHRALQLARSIDGERVFIATALASDAEMAERIERHRIERGADFRTVEVGVGLPEAIAKEMVPNRVVVVDCLTLWLANSLHQRCDTRAQIEAITATLAEPPCPVILVSNEVGMGLVPETRVGRDFRDAQGLLNREVAAVCERVEFMVAGLPLTLKPS